MPRPGYDILDVLVDGGRLRLHLDALDAGPEAAAGDGRQVIGVAGLEQVEVIGTDRAETLVLSSDAGILPPGHGVFVRAELGRDHIDASRVRADTVIEAGGTGLDPGEGAVIRGSAGFSDFITAGFGDDAIRTGDGGSSVLSGPGDNEVHLGRGRDVLRKVVGLDEEQHDTVFGFGGEEDVIALLGVPADTPGLLDTDGNGRLDARDGSVTAAGGDMTIDLAALPGGEGVTVTLVGRVRLDLDRIVVEEF